MPLPIPSRTSGSRCSDRARATLSLRDRYRRDMRAVKAVTDFRLVRFHGILDRDVGVYTRDSQGRPDYNFTYIDQIYDGLLQQGVRPFVELSFMPPDMARRQQSMGFWYEPDRRPTQGVAAGTRSSDILRGIWSSATGSMRFRNGISRSGTSPTAVSGAAIPMRRLTSIFMT